MFAFRALEASTRCEQLDGPPTCLSGATDSPAHRWQPTAHGERRRAVGGTGVQVHTDSHARSSSTSGEMMAHGGERALDALRGSRVVEK